MASLVGKLMGLSVDEKVLPAGDLAEGFDVGGGDDRYALWHVPALRPTVRRRLVAVALEPLEESLTALDEETAWRALDFHNWLWEYAAGGDVECARQLVEGGLAESAVRDEIYVQILVAINGADAPNFVDRCWHLLCAVVMTFPPSDELANYAFYFLGEARDARWDYASFCRVALAGVLEAGAAYMVAPSAADLATYATRPPVVARVERVDGVAVTEGLPLPPHVDCGRVAAILGSLFLELTDDRASTFGLVVVADGAEPRPLAPGDFPGDVVRDLGGAADFRFVFRRLVCYEGEPRNASDETFELLNFLQCEDDVVHEGRLTIDDATAGRLAALALTLEEREAGGGAARFQTAADLEAGLTCGLALGAFFPPDRARVAVADLAALALPHLGALVDASARELRRDFVDACKGHALYGAHVFACTLGVGADQGAAALELAARMPDGRVDAAVSARGLRLLDPRDHAATLRYVPRNDLRDWTRPAPGRVALKVAGDDDALVLATPNAAGLVAALNANVANVSPTPLKSPRPSPRAG